MSKMIPLDFRYLDADEMRSTATELRDGLARRRSVRMFSQRAIPLDVVRTAIDAAAQSPSGANKQPWTFVLVTDPEVKREIRIGAEKEEAAFYHERAPDDWLEALEPFGTDEHKPFLETAPALVVVFAQTSAPDGSKHYYVKESVGLATGILLATLHLSGLATLTHTPSPMKFLGRILGRPDNERPFLLIPVGYPSDDCEVPDIERKGRDEYLVEV